VFVLDDIGVIEFREVILPEGSVHALSGLAIEVLQRRVVFPRGDVVDQLAQFDTAVLLLFEIVQDAPPSFVAQYLEDVGPRQRLVVASRSQRVR
jgi:hypothetical protein